MTHLDDRQLRDKLAKAGSDMPHVDLWPHLHKEAAAISEIAQRRRRGAGFSPFTATRLLAPAFALLLVLSAGLTSLQGHQQRITDATPTLTATHADTTAVEASTERAAVFARRMAVADARMREVSARQYTTSAGATPASARLTDLDAVRLAARELRRELDSRAPSAPPPVRVRPGLQME